MEEDQAEPGLSLLFVGNDRKGESDERGNFSRSILLDSFSSLVAVSHSHTLFLSYKNIIYSYSCISLKLVSYSLGLESRLFDQAS